MTAEMSCPVCGTQIGLDHLFVDADNRAAVERLIATALPIGAQLLQYTRLFAPAKTALTQRKQVRIILQLLPDLERRAITHRGRDWVVPLSVWAQGIEQMLVARDCARLELPMKGHGYLYAILVALADKVEAVAEVRTEADKRTVIASEARQSMTPIGRDPTLARLAAEAGQAAPMPAELRAHLQHLKGAKK